MCSRVTGVKKRTAVIGSAGTIASMRSELRFAVAVAVPAALLVVLAVLQYRWIDEVSRGERDRARIHLHEAARRFGADLVMRFGAVREAFRLPPGGLPGSVEDRLVSRWQQYVENAGEPDLVRDVVVVSAAGEGSREGIVRLDPERGGFAPVAPDSADFALFREIAAGPPLRLANSLAVLVQPVGGRTMRNVAPESEVVIRLDTGVLFDRMLPELAERWFGGPGGLDSAVALLDMEPSHRRVVWTSDSTIDWSGPVDLEVPVLMPSSPMGPHGRRRSRGGPRAGGGQPWRDDRPTGAGSDEELGGVGTAWVVAVAQRAGSLDAAVNAARTRNLVVASAVLLLLAGSFAMSLVATQRARRTARQQVDFVASVTHELKTPLAAIRSAGENLADGIVSADPSVREYGALVDRESRRLDEMVTELLELAGLQTGRREPELAPVAVAGVVEGALEDCRWTLDESGVEVEVDVSGNLPSVLGERMSLRRALHNLIRNAAIYGASGGWVGVRARAQSRTGKDGVAITISDRGPGIPRAEQSRVFEPFVRGRDAGVVRASGSGLGLAIVRHVAEQHAGRVTLDSDGSGTAVTLWLPAASSTAPAATGSGS